MIFKPNAIKISQKAIKSSFRLTKLSPKFKKRMGENFTELSFPLFGKKLLKKLEKRSKIHIRSTHHSPLLRVIESLHKLNGGALATAGGPHECHGLPGVDL